MSFFKIALAVWLMLICSICYGDVPNEGCDTGNTIYTEYLGYAQTPNGSFMRYYKKTGAVVVRNYNSPYVCGGLNDFYVPTGRIYDPVNSITYNSCVTSNSLGGALINDGGAYIKFTYKKSEYCGTTPNNLPVDDGLWGVMAFSSIAVVFMMYRTKQITLFL
ncbi:hypothetical protein [Pedobacter sp. UBA5917]|jgi:hypothetical protein|uniref:hypothetical protein n=1 Tax=Pedobacter sp. UBA5917 TaxID=1947061 RepID=UPI0025F1149B|nr:hypothetical protein [Pedobacter sp. UBA5917]